MIRNRRAAEEVQAACPRRVGGCGDTSGCCSDDGIFPPGVVPTQDVLSMLSGIRRSLEEVSDLTWQPLQHLLPPLTLKECLEEFTARSRTGVCLEALAIPRHKEHV